MFKKSLMTIMCVVLFVASQRVFAEPRFADNVGSVRVADVKDISLSPMRVPIIFWGGDMATIYANGGLKTKPGTIFAKLGLNIELVRCDDPYQQVREAIEGKSAFFRGTFGMDVQSSEIFSSDPRTKPAMFMQLTWSAGDHCVAREEIKTISDLKPDARGKKKIAIQLGGPHDVGFLDDVLATGGFTRDDVELVWTKDVTGENGPAEAFRKDSSIAACFVVTPDMIGLTGGLDSVGTGTEGTVKGAHVLVSTAQLSYSIADTYECRKDFWDAHSDIVLKFTAGILKAQEEVIELKKAYESSPNTPQAKKYLELLQMTKDIFGKDIPTLEDAHGLLCDCTFVGHPGNVAFFTQANNPHGFEPMQRKLLDIAVSRGYAKVRQGIIPSPIDWNSSVFDFLTRKEVERGERFKAEAVIEEIEALTTGALDERTMFSFSINFKANQTDFSEVQYGTEYERVINILGKYGNAVVAIRGHSDSTKVLLEVIQAGMKKGVIERSGVPGNYTYSLRGRPLNLSSKDSIPIIMKSIEAGEFDGVADHNPREIMQAAANLSRQRAEAVCDSIIKFAKSKNIELDKSQIQPIGAGIREPFIVKPKNMVEAEQNMRVEFRLIRVTAEAMKPSDFDF